MATVTATWLENKVESLNNWIESNDASPHLMAIKSQAKIYYITKLGEMDEHELQTIEI
jgi:hypothetical protein